MTIRSSETPQVTEVRHTYGSAPDPAVVHTTEVRESSSAGWWLGALVAIVAILAVVFLVTRDPSTSAEDQIARAVEQTRTETALANVQNSVNEASLAAQQAADRTAMAASQAAADARAQAERAARSAGDAAQNAAASAPIVITPVEPAQ